MSTESIIVLILSLFPAMFIAALSYTFFKNHIDNENRQRQFLLQKDLQKQSLPLRLQAYERMALFMERISPSNLIVRINPNSSNKEDYESLLIATIEQEYQHNLTQQIYISDKCWAVINTAKNSTIQLIRKSAMLEKTDSAQKLREVILSDLMEKQAPSATALALIKSEVSELW
ncbi:hypothetical protein ACFQ1Q_01905 [Winogradskyella litorisediminis]|uniref:Uncharacterized protein n=1 Tax=Winogradskyella litorisediminis TaxID=1156618 RepID=A0ABW3N6A3_9FLAO